MSANNVVKEVKDHYRILQMPVFRKTEGVTFDNIPLEEVQPISAIDRVIHANNAFSPGPTEGVDRPWYMHPHQADNLVVLQGVRFVELFSMKTHVLSKFEVGPDYVKQDGELVISGGCMLTWPTHVFHRIITGEEGSASINFANHEENINMETNFNIYDLDLENGKFSVLRRGALDQN